MGRVLEALGEPAKALSYYEQALAMFRQLYPPARFKDGHPDLAVSLNSMGHVLDLLGERAKTLTYYERALAMRRKLYPPERFPDGHPDLAGSLNNMGYVLASLGERAKALAYFERALAMRQQLYPPARFKDGHPDLAASLNNMGNVLRSLGEPAKALTYYERALAMRQQLYPPARFKDGHPDLAASLNNMGAMLWQLGELAKAQTYDEQALAMRRKLYPPARFKDGHPDLAGSLNNMGNVLGSLGEPAKALTYFEQALAMYRQIAHRETSQTSEAVALAYRLAQPRTRDHYLSLAVSLASPPASYAAVWHSRGGVLPLLQARHRGVLALALTSDQVRPDYARLVAVRQDLSRLQRAFPTDDQARKARDERLVGLNDEQDRLERRLAAAMPAFRHLQALADKGPADLAQHLRKDAAFVDFLRYTHWEKTKALAGRYVAFVLLPGQEAKLVRLGDAQPIDAAVASWRRHLDAGEESLAPARLRELVWDKIAQELPPQT
jgi:tetratricopeptide (TPR) repeat protein